jgi:hypothetical protein
MENSLKVLQYELEFDSESLSSIILERVYGIGCERWAIRNDKSCLSKELDNTGYFHFVVEPMPSSRDEAFFVVHRWDAAENAYTFYIQNRTRILALASERRAWYDKFVRSG